MSTRTHQHANTQTNKHTSTCNASDPFSFETLTTNLRHALLGTSLANIVFVARPRALLSHSRATLPDLGAYLSFLGAVRKPFCFRQKNNTKSQFPGWPSFALVFARFRTHLRLPEISMGRCRCFAKLPRRRRGQDPRLSPHLTAPKETSSTSSRPPRPPQPPQQPEPFPQPRPRPDAPRQTRTDRRRAVRSFAEPVHPEDPSRQANVTEVPSIPK